MHAGVVVIIVALLIAPLLALSDPPQHWDLSVAVVVVALGAYALLAAPFSSTRERFTPAGGGVDLDLPKVQTALRSYYTVFSERSFPKGTPSREWGSLVGDRAPFFLPRAITVADQRKDGIALDAGEELTGPQSLKLGISAAGPFTLFAVLSAQEPVADLLRAYASNLPTTNNGVSVQLERVPTTSNQARLRVVFGDAKEPLISSAFTMQAGTPVAVCLTRSETTGLTATVSTDASGSQVVLAGARVALPAGGIQLSNKECVIRSGGGGLKLWAWGLYDEALTGQRLADLQAHLFEGFRRLEPSFLEQQALKDELARAKACPLSPDLCAKCAGVKDWSSFLSVMTTADDGCLKATHAFCLQNPQHPGCVACYGGGAKTGACERVRAFLSPPPPQPAVVLTTPVAAAPSAPAPPPPPVKEKKGFLEWLFGDDHACDAQSRQTVLNGG